jgi:hypothetical protein
MTKYSEHSRGLCQAVAFEQSSIPMSLQLKIRAISVFAAPIIKQIKIAFFPSFKFRPRLQCCGNVACCSLDFLGLDLSRPMVPFNPEREIRWLVHTA